MATKIEILIEEYGFETENEFAEAYMFDSIVPGICTNPDCNATYEYEPDQDKGWCEVCDTKTVKSGLILMGIM